MEEPPEEACDTEVCELDPLISELSGMDAKVSKDKGWHDHGSEEPDVEGVDSVMNIGFVLLQKRISTAPADYRQDAIDVG